MGRHAKGKSLDAIETHKNGLCSEITVEDSMLINSQDVLPYVL